MVVYHKATDLHLEVLSPVKNIDPLQSLFISIQEVPRRIPSTHLKVATVLAETHSKLPLLDDVMLYHRIIDWLIKVIICSGTLLAQPQDPISLLTKEILSLSVNTAKSVFKHVNSILKVFSKVNRVLSNEAFIVGPFSISLIETASLICRASAMRCLTVIELEVLRFLIIVQTIDMSTT